MRIFYYCMPCLRATSKQKDDRTTVYCRTIVFCEKLRCFACPNTSKQKYDRTTVKDDRTTVYCRTIVFLFQRVRTRKAAQFFVSGVKNEQ